MSMTAVSGGAEDRQASEVEGLGSDKGSQISEDLRVFSEYYGEEILELAPFLTPQRFAAGEVIFEEDEPGTGVYFLISGKVKLAKRSSGGRRQILKLVGPGEILGEEVLFSGEGYGGYAKALEPVRAYYVSIKTLAQFLSEHPRVATRLIEHLAREIKGFQDKILETSYGSSLERIARLLLAIADRWGVEEDGKLYIGVQLSRTELAELAGIANETASRLLSRLRDRGMIDFIGAKIFILDRERLENLTKPLCVDLKEILL